MAEPVVDRGVFALRQGALVTVALLVGGLVAERLRPDEALERGMVSSAFLWAIVVWVAVLGFNTLAFDRSQMGVLERAPLVAAAALGVVVFVVGLIGNDTGPAGRRIAYLFANSVGVVVFWWGILGLIALLVERLRAPTC